MSGQPANHDVQKQFCAYTKQLNKGTCGLVVWYVGRATWLFMKHSDNLGLLVARFEVFMVMKTSNCVT